MSVLDIFVFSSRKPLLKTAAFGKVWMAAVCWVPLKLEKEYTLVIIIIIIIIEGEDY